MRQQVGVTSQLVNVDPVLLPVCQASPYEGLEGDGMTLRTVQGLEIDQSFIRPQNLLKFTHLCFITGNRLDRELDISSFEYGIFLQDVLL